MANETDFIELGLPARMSVRLFTGDERRPLDETQSIRARGRLRQLKTWVNQGERPARFTYHTPDLQDHSGDPGNIAEKGGRKFILATCPRERTTRRSWRRGRLTSTGSFKSSMYVQPILFGNR